MVQLYSKCSFLCAVPHYRVIPRGVCSGWFPASKPMYTTGNQSCGGVSHKYRWFNPTDALLHAPRKHNYMHMCIYYCSHGGVDVWIILVKHHGIYSYIISKMRVVSSYWNKSLIVSEIKEGYRMPLGTHTIVECVWWMPSMIQYSIYSTVCIQIALVV